VNDNSAFSFYISVILAKEDASQYILSDQIVNNASQDLVKFLVISSDVVYPDGAMKDYERNFWLPMKGVQKPVFAIPGNHDWYDALEGFAATFYDSTSASKAMRARRAADLDLTSATHKTIQTQLVEASRLRKEYRIPTGYQQAPYFQLQTKDFAFICVETGVLRRIDDVQMEWLKQSLEASQGKFIFVLAGHPFYAAGEYQGNMNTDFAALHELCRKYKVRIVMAGDTHDLEYYEEPLDENDPTKKMYHFVNGGGGAYLSLGAALKPANEMPEKVWAHYPAAAQIIDKIEKNTGVLKKPAWIWTKKYNGWPFSAEWLSAAFDYNKAPFFQSYMEIQVDPIQNTVKLVARGINGPLTWSEMEYSEGLKPAGIPDDAAVEWLFPLKTTAKSR
jgi:3',5'-cyclic AMP phosphodiesterase CpdA